METDTAKCPDGWELKQVIGNPDGQGRGDKVVNNACIPTKKQPRDWIVKNGVYVPECEQENPPFREELWCIWN